MKYILESLVLANFTAWSFEHSINWNKSTKHNIEYIWRWKNEVECKWNLLYNQIQILTKEILIGFGFCKCIQTLLQDKCLEELFGIILTQKRYPRRDNKDFNVLMLSLGFFQPSANNIWTCVNPQRFLKPQLFGTFNRLTSFHIEPSITMYIK